MNETNAANKNFDAFIVTMATENSKIEKINTITGDPDSIHAGSRTEENQVHP